MSDPRLHVLRDEGLGNSAYVLELGGGRALAVDVSRDLRALDRLVADRGLTVAFAAETHLHADFLSGCLDLARRDGTRVLASAAGLRAFDHVGLGDGDEVDLGGLRLRTLLTPGHTDEHVAFQVLDGQRTVGVFTGGSLIVGAAARTDLIEPDRTEELARAQYRSLQRLAGLGDDVAVWPTHGGGSFCSVPSTAGPTTTVGVERATNSLLNAPDEDAFVRALLGSLGTYPSYFHHLSELNRTGPAPVAHLTAAEATCRVAALSPPDVAAAQARGVEIIDVRPVRDFSAGHIPGSISIPLRPVFVSWLGWLVEFDHPLAVVRNPDQDLTEVWWQAHKIGYDHIVGELADGLNSWAAAGLPVSTIPLIEPSQLTGRPVLDVRQRREFAEGHVPDAVNVELGALTDPATHPARPAGVPATRSAADPDSSTVVMCGHGERAMSAASVLARTGRSDLVVLEGGAEDWAEHTGRALASEDRTDDPPDTAPAAGQGTR